MNDESALLDSNNTDLVVDQEDSSSGEKNSGVPFSKQSMELQKILKISNNPAFQKYVPGYIQYLEARPKVDQPFFHGTGSFALKRILSEGLLPRGKERRFSGEAVSVDHEGDKPYISLAIGGQVGENLAAAYGYSSSNAEAIEFNADELLPVSRRERVVQALGGIDKFVDEYVASWVNPGNIKDVDKYRKVMEQEMGFLMENALGYGNYVYSQERTMQNISQLNDLIDGRVKSLERVRKILFRNNIMKGKLDKEMLVELESLTSEKEKSTLGKKILAAIDRLSAVSQSYSELSSEEREELENQFPVVMLIEGKELAIEGSGSLVTQERKCVSSITPDKVVEIRVPQKNVSIVEKWVSENGLSAKVVPLEFFEVQEVVQNKK